MLVHQLTPKSVVVIEEDNELIAKLTGFATEKEIQARDVFEAENVSGL